MPRIRKKLAGDALAKVTAAISALQQTFDQPPPTFELEEISAQLDVFEKAVADLRNTLKLKEPQPDTPEPDPGDTPGHRTQPPAAHSAKVGTFLEGMASSMVGIQRRLEAHNTEYLATALSDPAVVPAQFRMPKLSAELHFALEQVSSEGWDILIYEKANEARELHQQTLTAEMVAAPPPPELLERLRAETPQVSLVLAPKQRAQIRRTVEQSEPRVQSELLDSWARVLIFRGQEAARKSGAGAEYLLALSRGTDDDGDLGIWHVCLDPPSVAVARRYGVKPRSSEQTAALRAFLNTVADSQAAWLERLGTLV